MSLQFVIQAFKRSNCSCVFLHIRFKWFQNHLLARVHRVFGTDLTISLRRHGLTFGSVDPGHRQSIVYVFIFLEIIPEFYYSTDFVSSDIVSSELSSGMSGKTLLYSQHHELPVYLDESLSLYNPRPANISAWKNVWKSRCWWQTHPFRFGIFWQFPLLTSESIKLENLRNFCSILPNHFLFHNLNAFQIQTFYPDSKPRVRYFSETINKITDTLLNLILFTLMGSADEVYNWSIFKTGFQHI